MMRNRNTISLNKISFFVTEVHFCESPHTDNSQNRRCLDRFQRFWFNVNSGKCENIIYGGCGATKNNFETLAECEYACEGYNRNLFEI